METEIIYRNRRRRVTIINVLYRFAFKNTTQPAGTPGDQEDSDGGVQNRP